MSFLLDWIDCPTSTLRVGLARASTALDPRGGVRDGILLEVEPVDCATHRANVVWAVAGTRTPAGAFGGGISTSIQVTHGTMTGTFPVAMDTTIREGLASLPPGVPLRFTINASGPADGSGSWLVALPGVWREAFEPCGFDVPQLVGSVVALSPMADGSLCALTESPSPSGTMLQAQRSTDGLAWEALGSPMLDTGTLGGATLQLRPDGNLRGAILRTVTRPTGIDANDVLLITSADCASWEVLDAGLTAILPPSVSPRGVGLATNDAETRLTLVLRDPPSLLDLVSSNFGPPFTGRPAEPLPMTGPLREGIALGLRPLSIGNDRLMLASTAAGAALYLYAPDPMRADPWVALGAPLVAPSNIDGTFDRSTIEGLAVVPWSSAVDHVRLAVAYGGGPRGTCPDCTFPSATTLVDLLR